LRLLNRPGDGNSPGKLRAPIGLGLTGQHGHKPEKPTQQQQPKKKFSQMLNNSSFFFSFFRSCSLYPHFHSFNFIIQISFHSIHFAIKWWIIQGTLTYREGETGRAKRRRRPLLPPPLQVPAGDGDARWGKISGTLTGRTSVVRPWDSDDDDDDPLGTSIH
jgi:hypothetical protein